MTSELLIEQACEFSREILRPNAGEFDRSCEVPSYVIQDMAEKGFLASVLPKKYGGLGLSKLEYGRLTSEIGKGCSSARTLLTVHTSLVGETILKFGNDIQKQQWLPAICNGKKLACFCLSEPEAGSDAASIRTEYEKVNDGYVLNGVKKYISYGGIADWFLVFANCDGVKTAFLVDRSFDGLETIPMTGLMAGRGSHIAEVHLNKVFVPAENVLGNLGSGIGFVANTALFYGRYSVAWAALALAEAALEEMVSYARKRNQSGSKIAQHQLIQQMIANGVAGVHSSRAVCERAGRMRDEGHDDAVDETNIAKYVASKSASSISSDAVQVFGGNGISNSYPVERLFREAKIFEIIEGSTQIQQLMIAEFGLNRYRLVS